MKRTVIWLVLLLLTGVGGFAFAHQEGTVSDGQQDGMMMGGEMMEMMHGGMVPGGHHGMMGHGGTAERPLISLMLQNKGELQLTSEQVQKLEALRVGFQKGAIKRSADLQLAELELEELRKKEPVDLAKVEAQVKRIEALRAEQRLSRIRAIEEGKALLTPEQRQKLNTLGQRAGGGYSTGMTGCPTMMGGMGRMMRPSESPRQ
jgi:Spy/CpxP family protein refolding chaperone